MKGNKFLLGKPPVVAGPQSKPTNTTFCVLFTVEFRGVNRQIDYQFDDKRQTVQYSIA